MMAINKHSSKLVQFVETHERVLITWQIVLKILNLYNYIRQKDRFLSGTLKSSKNSYGQVVVEIENSVSFVKIIGEPFGIPYTIHSRTSSNLPDIL